MVSNQHNRVDASARGSVQTPMHVRECNIELTDFASNRDALSRAGRDQLGTRVV
jgi:hypothetical protein